MKIVGITCGKNPKLMKLKRRFGSGYRKEFDCIFVELKINIFFFFIYLNCKKKKNIFKEIFFIKIKFYYYFIKK